MIVVTGGAGFIGSNLVHALNARGRCDIVVVDELSDGRKCLNLADCIIADYLDRDEWLDLVRSGGAYRERIECVYHLGACTDTTAWDGRAMMADNFTFSRATFDYCVAGGIPLIYASSAAVYGATAHCVEEPACERPLNLYAWSKLVFDQYVRTRLNRVESLVAGVRFFNVYGPRESHKGRMASVIWHFAQQLAAHERVRLFEGSHGFAAGEQRRDFVYIDDAVEVTLWLARQPPTARGIYNCGSGRATTFNAVARAVLEWHGRGQIEYVSFPPSLIAAYQAHTEADLARLRALGYDAPMRDAARGIRDYLDWLAAVHARRV